MVRIEFLCISSFQPNRSSYSKSQEGEVFEDHDYTMVENTVLVSHDGSITEKFPDTSSSKHTDFTMQKISKTPTLSENEIISHSLIRENLENTNLPREIADVIADSWRTPKVGTNQFAGDGLLKGHRSLYSKCKYSVVIHAWYVHKWLLI